MDARKQRVNGTANRTTFRPGNGKLRDGAGVRAVSVLDGFDVLALPDRTFGYWHDVPLSTLPTIRPAPALKNQLFYERPKAQRDCHRERAPHKRHRKDRTKKRCGCSRGCLI